MANIQKINNEISNVVEFLHNKNEIKPFLEDIFLIRLQVAGMDFIDNIDEIFPNLNNGTKLELFREKDNEFDKLAILVKYNGNKIGYVPRKHNVVLAHLLDGGKELYGVVCEAFQDEIYEGYPFKVVEFEIYLKE